MMRPLQETGRQVPMRFLRTTLTPFLVVAVGTAACAPDSPPPHITYINPTAAATVAPFPLPTDTPRPEPTRIPPTPTNTPRPRPTDTPTPERGKSPQDLFRALLTTPFTPDEVPTGFTAGGIIVRDLDATTKAFNAVGRVEAAFASRDTIFGPTVPGQARNSSTVPGMAGIAYIFFSTESDAIAYSKTLLKQPNRTINLVGRVVILAEKYGVYNSLQELQQTTERLGESAATHLQRILRQ